jgi:hypothetical protein
MTTYKRTHSRTYRRIYEQYYGPIPKDEHGRSYEIHHIDGDHKNNDINNLQLVTIEEHFKIHLDQGDIGSASRIAKRMHQSLSSKELSDISRIAVQDQIERGVHNFSNPELHKQYIAKQLQDGSHPFLRSDIQSDNGKKGAAASRPKRSARFFADNPNYKPKTCEHCGKTVTAPVYGKCHGSKCKSLQHSNASDLRPVIVVST